LEAWSGQTVGKRLAGVQVYGPVRAWPSALAVAGRTLLRVVDFVPVMCLAGFITMLTTGGQQRIGDLAARTAAARAAAARYRAMAAVPLAAVVLAAVGLSAYRATSPETTLTYRAHGVWLGYPAGWQEQTGHTAGRRGKAMAYCGWPRHAGYQRPDRKRHEHGDPFGPHTPGEQPGQREAR